MPSAIALERDELLLWVTRHGIKPDTYR